MPDLSDIVAGTDKLRKLAEEALERKLAANGDDTQTLLQLGEIYRQEGRRTAALELFTKVAKLDPTHSRANYVKAILAGDDPPESADLEGPRPAPFGLVPDFLTASELERLWELVKAKRDRFAPSVIAGKGVNLKKRSSMVLYDDELTEMSGWFLARVESSLSLCWSKLEIEPFSVVHREIQLTRHMDGAFFKIHRDVGDEGGTTSRKATFVYYFFRQPKRFQGGDLLLFDTDPESGGQAMGFTRVEPVDNTLLLFPSHFWHQVTPLECVGDEFESGRFTLNGWLHDAASS